MIQILPLEARFDKMIEFEIELLSLESLLRSTTSGLDNSLII